MILKTWWCSFTHILVLGMLLVTCLRDVPSGRRMPGGCQPHAYNLVWTCLKHQSGMGQNLSHTDPTLFGQTDTVTGFEYKYIHIYILIYIISLISFIITIYIYLCIYYKLQYIYTNICCCFQEHGIVIEFGKNLSTLRQTEWGPFFNVRTWLVRWGAMGWPWLIMASWLGAKANVLKSGNSCLTDTNLSPPNILTTYIYIYICRQNII
jgi:hypothetical protein